MFSHFGKMKVWKGNTHTERKKENERSEKI